MSTKILPSRQPLAGSIGIAKKPVLPIHRPHLPAPVGRDDLSARITQAKLYVQLVQYLKQGCTGEHPAHQYCTPRAYLALLRSLAIPLPKRCNPTRHVAVERVLHLFHAEARRQRKSRQTTVAPVPQRFVLCYNNLAWVEPFPRRAHNLSRKSQETPLPCPNSRKALEFTSPPNLAKGIPPGLILHDALTKTVDLVIKASCPARACEGAVIRPSTVNALFKNEPAKEKNLPSYSKSISNTCNNL